MSLFRLSFLVEPSITYGAGTSDSITLGGQEEWQYSTWTCSLTDFISKTTRQRKVCLCQKPFYSCFPKDKFAWVIQNLNQFDTTCVRIGNYPRYLLNRRRLLSSICILSMLLVSKVTLFELSWDLPYLHCWRWLDHAIFSAMLFRNTAITLSAVSDFWIYVTLLKLSTKYSGTGK